MKSSKIFSLIFIFILISCTKKESSKIQPKVSNVTESVYASGMVKAENQYTVYATISGVLQKINVEVGQTITQGQSLFKIDNDKAKLNTENARLAYQMSQGSSSYIQNKIAESELRVQAAKDKMDLDKAVFDKNKNIKQYNVISEVDYERVELAYKNSKSNYEATQKQLTQLKIQLVSEQNRNSNNLKLSEKSQGDYTVKSEISGILYDVLIKEGTLISPQTPLAIIGEKNAYLLELDVDENDMVRVKIGQKLEITMDSYKEQSFEATVDKIYPIMDVRSRTFKIEAHFTTPPKKLYPNLTAEANIIIQTKKNVLTIPRGYLVEDTYVLVNNDEKRKVKVGLVDYQNVEILDGLSADETICLPK